jgi:hypothetical protein
MSSPAGWLPQEHAAAENPQQSHRVLLKTQQVLEANRASSKGTIIKNKIDQ